MQALVIVEHEGDFYNLYLSDESGIFYSLSLRDIVIETRPNLQIDLELVGHVHRRDIRRTHLQCMHLQCAYIKGKNGKECCDCM